VYFSRICNGFFTGNLVQACDKAFAHFSAKISVWLCQCHEHRSPAIRNAASIAGLLLTTECLITEIPEKEKKAPAGHGPGMGG